MSIVGCNSLSRRPMSASRMLKISAAVGVTRRTVSCPSNMTVGMWMLLRKLFKSLLTCSISIFRLLNSSFNVVSSSLVD